MEWVLGYLDGGKQGLSGRSLFHLQKEPRDGLIQERGDGILHAKIIPQSITVQNGWYIFKSLLNVGPSVCPFHLEEASR